MHAHRDALVRTARAENEAEKAIRFAAAHGEWPLAMSDAASRAIARRADSDDLQRRWGDLVESILRD